jgi:hypothetical protein
MSRGKSIAAQSLWRKRWTPLIDWLERASFGTKENVNLFANSSRAFDIGEVSTILQCDHVCIWNRLSDVLSRGDGDKFVIARDDQRRDAQALELKQADLYLRCRMRG